MRGGAGEDAEGVVLPYEKPSASPPTILASPAQSRGRSGTRRRSMTKEYSPFTSNRLNPINTAYPSPSSTDKNSTPVSATSSSASFSPSSSTCPASFSTTAPDSYPGPPLITEAEPSPATASFNPLPTANSPSSQMNVNGLSLLPSTLLMTPPQRNTRKRTTFENVSTPNAIVTSFIPTTALSLDEEAGVEQKLNTSEQGNGQDWRKEGGSKTEMERIGLEDSGYHPSYRRRSSIESFDRSSESPPYFDSNFLTPHPSPSPRSSPLLHSNSASPPLASFTRPPSISSINSVASAYYFPPTPQHSSRSSPMQLDMSNLSSTDHHAHQSLTSACPPATSGYKSSSSGITKALGLVFTRNQANENLEADHRRDWGRGSDEINEEEVMRSDGLLESRRGSRLFKSRSFERRRRSRLAILLSRLAAIASIPSSIISFFITPMASLSNPHQSPALHHSSARTIKPKRYLAPLVRLFTLSYLIFSASYFSIDLIFSPSPLSSHFRSSKLVTRSSTTSSSLSTSSRGNYHDLFDSHVNAFRAGVGLVDKSGGGRVIDFANEWARKAGREWSQARKEQVNVVPVVETTLTPMWGMVGRLSSVGGMSREGSLNQMSQAARFAKMHDQLDPRLSEEIIPFFFRATTIPAMDDITACIYTNEAWLSTLPDFVRSWRGPISLVFESTHSQFDSAARDHLYSTFSSLRQSNRLIRELVDIHIVGVPRQTTEKRKSKTRLRMIERPVAKNFMMNLARFFASTEMVLMNDDARVLPSEGLRERLRGEDVRERVTEQGDAVVVPTFGFKRSQSIPPLGTIRNTLVGISEHGGREIGATEFEELASQFVRSHFSTLPLSVAEWPIDRNGIRVALTSGQMGIFDEGWELNAGPTDYSQWIDPASSIPTPLPLSSSSSSSLSTTVTTSSDLYRISAEDYDPSYAPTLLISRKGQPWCTERFDSMPSACVYQLYLSGADLWVLREGGVYTIEELGRRGEEERGGGKAEEVVKLKEHISTRLYGKYHHEACMHYARELLSMQMWENKKAEHLREVCSEILANWSM